MSRPAGKRNEDQGVLGKSKVLPTSSHARGSEFSCPVNGPSIYVPVTHSQATASLASPLLLGQMSSSEDAAFLVSHMPSSDLNGY